MKYIIALIMGLLFTSCAIYSVKTANPSKVDIRVENNGHSVLTFWRKLNVDGTKGQRFSAGGNSRFAMFLNLGFKKAYTDTITLDAGTYYLDFYKIDLGKDQYIVSQKGHFWRANGWDDKNSKPLYVSFKVGTNQHLTLPTIYIELKDNDGQYEAKFHFDNKDHIYTVGKLAE